MKRTGNWIVVIHEGDVVSEDVDTGEEEIGESEVSVCRKSYKLGQRSWGWDGKDKIIIPSGETLTTKQKQKRAEVIAAALNEHEWRKKLGLLRV